MHGNFFWYLNIKIFRYPSLKVFPLDDAMKKLGQRAKAKVNMTSDKLYNKFSSFMDMIDVIEKDKQTVGFHADFKTFESDGKKHILLFMNDIIKSMTNETIYILSALPKYPDIQGMKQIITFIRTDKKGRVSKCFKIKEEIKPHELKANHPL